jgi:galactokinase
MSQDSFVRADKLFETSFHEKGKFKLFSPGRLEILGNHTDHQRGHCLVAGCSLGISAVISPSNDGLISIASEGYPRFSFPANDLSAKESEKFSSLALVRGVVGSLQKMGYKVGAFKAALNSDIFSGAGVSSSAAYELFIGEAISALFNGDKIPRIDLAKAGQIAENVYFGKASGLLDQCGASFGAVQFLDFRDASKPVVSPLSFPSEWNLSLYLVNPGGSHAGLSDLYSEMPNDMKLVAKELFHKEVLSEVPEKLFYSKIYSYNEGKVPERALERARHFFGEERRVDLAKESFFNGNRGQFLALEKATELSQESLLHNVMIPGHYEGSPLEAVNRAKEALHEGASRVMGGGLVGTTINFVPVNEKKEFLEVMHAYYGEKKVVEVSIPPLGAHIVE